MKAFLLFGMAAGSAYVAGWPVVGAILNGLQGVAFIVHIFTSK